MLAAFATFVKTDTDNSRNYRIRINVLASRLLNGAKYVRILKSEKHIIIEPVKTEVDAHRVGWRDGAATISLNRSVFHHGFLRPEIFGKRYRVKRDNQGRIYICLQEEI